VLFPGIGSREVKEMTKKVMRLLDWKTGLMECKVCGTQHAAARRPGGLFYRGSWQCSKGCRLEDKEAEKS